MLEEEPGRKPREQAVSGMKKEFDTIGEKLLGLIKSKLKGYVVFKDTGNILIVLHIH